MIISAELAGVDLAWQSEKNPTAVAIGSLSPSGLVVNYVLPAIYGISNVLDTLQQFKGLSGIAIDAPLVIPNKTGQRLCEKEIGVTYCSRKASCHTSNTTLYPDAKSVELSNALSNLGFSHLDDQRWQIECYPHPAIIEIFGLDERLKYKKGRVSEKKAGQIKLGQLVQSLSSSSVLKLKIAGTKTEILEPSYIETLSGQALKSNEDALDAIICLYIAALYSIGGLGRCFGNVKDGYIWVPQHVCILPSESASNAADRLQESNPIGDLGVSGNRLDDIFRKIGRIVVNFQKLEGMLKGLVSVPNYSGSVAEIQRQRLKHHETLRKKSLGMVIADFFEKVYLEGDSQDTLGDPQTHEIRIKIVGGEREQLKTLLETIALERNELIHTKLLGFDPNSEESCIELEAFLDEQYVRVKPAFEQVNLLFDHMKEHRATTAEKISAELRKRTEFDA